MGRYTFKLPDIGEGIAEAEIVAWHVKLGDWIEEDDRVADMMTDKATVEMESPVSGIVVEVAGEVGDVVAIGAPLVVIEVEGEGEVSTGPSTGAAVVDVVSEPEVPAALAEPSPPPPPSPPKPAQPEPAKAPAPAKTQTPPASHSKAIASPAVRARAIELGIDLGEVRAADGNRVRHADLDAFLSYSGPGGYRAPGLKGEDQQIRVIGLRSRIAENMAASKRNIPHFSYVEECDVTALETMRGQLNEHRGEKPKLTMLPMLITALCKALPAFPMINARYDDEAGVVTRYAAVHLGLAAQTPSGLMVPVIRNAQDRNLWQLATEIARLAQAARNGTATSEELSGSTLTVTSLGALGGVATTPVINRPEVAIIGPNRIIERPMFVSDGMGGERIEKRKLMNISISCDHRVVDGWDAASFVQAVKTLIETPVLLLAN